MLIFFDFLFYSAYKIYRNVNDDGPEFAGAFAISALQSFNIYSVILICNIVTGKEIFSTIIALGIFGILMIINYIRYLRTPRFSIDVIKDRWGTKSLNYQKDNRLLQGIYLAASILTFFGLVFYLANRKM